MQVIAVRKPYAECLAFWRRADADLRRLVAARATASEAAAALGTTRNAVIGRATRTGLRWARSPLRHPPCVECQRPVRRRKGERKDHYLRRRTCSPECFEARRRRPLNVGWPEITGPENPGGRFDDYDARFRSGGLFTLSRPPTKVATGTVLGGL